MAGCQWSIGSWLVTMVAPLPWRWSSTSSRSWGSVVEYGKRSFEKLEFDRLCAR